MTKFGVRVFVFIFALVMVACGGEIQPIDLGPVEVADGVMLSHDGIVMPPDSWLDFNQCVVVEYDEGVVTYPDLTITTTTTVTLGLEMPIEWSGDFTVLTGTAGACNSTETPGATTTIQAATETPEPAIPTATAEASATITGIKPIVVAVAVTGSTALTPTDAQLYNGPNVNFNETIGSGEAEDVLLTKLQPTDFVQVVHHPAVRVTQDDPGACKLQVKDVDRLGADGYIVGENVSPNPNLALCFP